MKFAIGQPVRRKEDDRFITGKGQYVDDVSVPGQAHAAFVRSPHAHALIKGIDVAAAKAAPGVLAVYTAADAAAFGLKPIKCAVPLKNRDGSDYWNPGRTQLAGDRVRHVGDAVAMVVAETYSQARDAAEMVEVDYEPLPAVTDPVAATKPGGPTLWDGRPDNVALDWGMGDEAAVNAAFASAHKVVSLDLKINRVVIASMEARGLLAQYDPATESYLVDIGSQGVFAQKRNLASALGVKSANVRVRTGDVGGSFGMKGFDFPENALVPMAAKLLGRPVKWISDRSEAFLTDTQGREQAIHAELALDANGKFLAIRSDSIANCGAYLSYFSIAIPTVAGGRLLPGVYQIPAAYMRVRVVNTNTVWTDAYRGAGRPEVSYIVERLVDQAAREMGLSPWEIRQRNFIPASAMPYKTAMGMIYDSGDFAATLAKGLKAADVEGFPARRAEAKARGKLRGMGLSYYVEVTANGPQEAADIKFGDDGRIRMGIGAGPSGQGHETAFAQILSDKLGLDFEKIDFIWGDSAELTQGGGTGGAKTLMLAGSALYDASAKIIAKGKKLAGHILEAAEGDIEFDSGTFRIAGTDRSIGIMDLAKKAKETKNLPEGVPDSLDEIGKSDADKNTFPNGAHVCEIEIDPETGNTQVVNYTMVDDFGLVVNPLLIEGQIHGGLAQGIGQCLMEDFVVDPASGQVLTGSFQDYCMPRASDMPPMEIGYNNVPCTTNVMGVKGAGEAGSVGALGSVMNALADALAPLGIRHVDMPATPQKIWTLIQQAGGGRAAAE